MTEEEFYKKVDGECHEDLIVFIRQKYKSETEYEYTNQLYLAEGIGFVWQVDWHEGQEDVEILGYIPVREVEPLKHACCKDGKANYSEIPTGSTTKNDLGVSSELEKNSKKLEKNFGESDCISRADAIYAVSEALERTFVEHEDIANKIIGKLPSVTPQEPRWIPTSERLPEENGGYLVTVKRGYVTTALWVGNAEYWNEVTAWMPLPKPYREVEE